MVYNMNDGQLSEVPLIKKRIERPDYKQSCHSADSLYSMLGCGYDLFVRDNRSGRVKRITFDGKEDAAYTYRNSKDTLSANSRGFWLGHRYIYMMQDMSEVKEVSLIHSLGHSRPVTNTFKMPMPGDAGVRQYRIYWYDADHGEGRLLPIEKYPDQLVAMDFFRSSTALYITRRSRKADKVDLAGLMWKMEQ